MLPKDFRFCPHCGASLKGRNGTLPPLKQHIYDTIKAAGEIGITSQDLMGVVYHQGRKQPQLPVIRNHIGQINDLLADTDYRIETHDRRHWILTKRKL